MDPESPSSSRDATAARLTSAGALATIVIGLVVLAGWAANIDSMRRFFVDGLHMLPNTAVAFVAAGVSLLLQFRSEPTTGARWKVARGLALFVLVIGVLTLCERALDWTLGIDDLLFRDSLRSFPYRPYGRMASNSTLAFILAGGALFLLDGQTERVRRMANVFATGGLAIAMLALVGHLYGANSLYQMDAAAGMATVTALAFFTINAGILCARPATSWVGRLLSRGGGGMLARRILLAITLLPLFLGWAYVQSRISQIVSRETGMAIIVVVMIGIQLTVVLRAASAVQAGEKIQAIALDKEAAARAEAERANRAKNDFLAVMSHELRTPLNAIIGYGALMREGIPDPATKGQRHQLDRIGASAKHLLALIDEVLTLSRLELGEERVTPAPVSVCSLVEEVAGMTELEARRKGLELTLELPSSDVTIVTDTGKLRQALLNLVGNAIKFTDRGSVSIVAFVEREGEEIVFAVRDTGLGIAPAHLPKVFEAFWQVDQAATRRAGGTGLGLHVTRRLLRLLGGDVKVESTLGEGSTFTIRLPRIWWNLSDEHAVQLGGATGATGARRELVTAKRS
ncbi:MAG TPA: HAMP domain-containing sensor histidine kinase [Gemmatimonadaceae bacterium]|nr:HAMP domain-containing sensor histidine kinase [Gemmatimonadaceae bacterium]